MTIEEMRHLVRTADSLDKAVKAIQQIKGMLNHNDLFTQGKVFGGQNLEWRYVGEPGFANTLIAALHKGLDDLASTYHAKIAKVNRDNVL